MAANHYFPPFGTTTADTKSGRMAVRPVCGHCEAVVAMTPLDMVNQFHQIVATDILFFHDHDERAFFEWIDRMPFVRESYGEGRSMFLLLNRFPTDEDIWELLGFCRRYGVAMTQLASFLTDENRSWFFDPKMVWFAEVFGSGRTTNGS